MHFGDLALVIPGWRDSEPCVLKISWREHPTGEEAVALRTWAGRGVVRLLDASVPDGALLLERLDSARSLEDLDLLQARRALGCAQRQTKTPLCSLMRNTPFCSIICTTRWYARASMSSQVVPGSR